MKQEKPEKKSYERAEKEKIKTRKLLKPRVKYNKEQKIKQRKVMM